MQLKFTISETDALALSNQFYSDSALHQRLRNRSRWTVPILLIPIIALFTYQFGFSIAPAAIFIVGSIAWVIIAPKRFDGRINRYIQKQMRESSYSKAFGDYSLTIEDDHLISDGPTGHSKYKWDAVDRVLLTTEFLFVFIAGASGYPIRISEIGQTVAEEAHRRMKSLVDASK